MRYKWEKMGKKNSEKWGKMSNFVHAEDRKTTEKSIWKIIGWESVGLQNKKNEAFYETEHKIKTITHAIDGISSNNTIKCYTRVFTSHLGTILLTVIRIALLSCTVGLYVGLPIVHSTTHYKWLHGPKTP